MRSLATLVLIAFSLLLHAQQSAPFRVLDPLAVTADSDPSTAILSLTPPAHPFELPCDVAIIGGELGGVAAAYEAAGKGMHVCLTEPTHWIGGQLTAQGVAAFDDNQWTETTGSSRSFLELRARIRSHYAPLLRTDFRNGSDPLNPGRCWVSYECTEATVAHDALRQMLAPLESSHRLTLLLRTAPLRVERSGNHIDAVLVYNFESHTFTRIRAHIFLDATAQGEFLPLSGAEYVTGAEARATTGEPDAPLTADPSAAQSFTYPFVLGIRSTATQQADPQPAGYQGNLPHFSFNSTDADAVTLRYGMFATLPQTPGSFWTYRRLVDASIFRPGSFASDLAMINWDSNDLCDSRLLSDNPLDQARAMQHGKQLALGFAWWLRHDAPADSGSGHGFPQVELQSTALGSSDGLAQFPYIREARRMKALTTIREQDVATAATRANSMPATVGIGQYPIDIHACVGAAPHLPASKPHQIPLGALIPIHIDNLLAASKSLGTTHITNGAYRVHPTEWAIGIAAGATAAQSIGTSQSPRALLESPSSLLKLQHTLLDDGQPLIWFDDLGPGSPGFLDAQLAILLGLLDPGQSLSFRPLLPISASEVDHALDALIARGSLPRNTMLPPASAASLDWQSLRALGVPVPSSLNGPVLRLEFAHWAVKEANRR